MHRNQVRTLGFLGAAACLLVLPAARVQAEAGPAPRIRNVYIPADQMKVLFDESDKGVLMPRDRVLALWRKARSQSAAEPVPPADTVLAGAVYEAELAEHELRLTGRLRIVALSDTSQTVDLPFGGLAIESARMDDTPARLGLRDDGTLFLLLPKGLSQFSRHEEVAPPNNPSATKMGLSPSPIASPRRFDLQLEMSAPLAGKDGDLAVTLRLPPAPGSEVLLRLDEGKRLQRGETVLLPESTEDGRQTFRIAVDRTGLMPLVISNRLADGNRAPLVFVHSRATGHVEPAGLGWQAVLDFDVYARATDTFELRLPDSVDVAEIDAPQLRQWTLHEPAGGAVAVTLAFHQPVLGRRTVRISGLASVPGAEEGGGPWSFPAVHVVDAAAHAGQVLVYAAPTLRVETGESTGIGAARLANLVSDPPPKPTGSPLAFTFWDQDYRLPLIVSPRRRTVQASIATLVQVHRTGLTLRGSLTAQSRHAPIFDVEVQLPREWRVTSVQSAGEPIAWEVAPPVDGDAEAHSPVQTLRVEPAEPANPGDTLDLTLNAELQPDGWFEDEQPREVAMPELRLLEADEVEGTVLVQAPADIDLQVEDVPDGLQPVFDPQSTDAGEGPHTSLQYRYEDAARVDGRLLVRRKPGVVSAMTLAMVRLDRGKLDVHYQLDLHVRQGTIREFGFTLPAEVGEKIHVVPVGWSGRVIEQRHRPIPGDGADDAPLNLWQIVLDRPVTGDLTLALDFGQTFSSEAEAGPSAGPSDGVPPPPTTATPVAVPVLAMQDIASQTGIVAVEAAAGQRIDCRTANLRELDPAEVAQPAAYVPRHRIVAAYQYRRLPYELTLAATQYAPAPTVDAICESAEIVSVAGREGRTRHQAWFLVRGHQLQHVPVTLPDGADLWAVMLDQEPVEVRRQDGVYYVPVPARQANAASGLRDLTLVYETGAPGPTPNGSRSGVRPRSVRYGAPAVAMPTLETTWHLAAPEGTNWVSTGGDYRTEAPSTRPILATRLAESIARHGASGLGWKFAGLLAAGIIVGVYSLVTSDKVWRVRVVEVLVVVVVLLVLVALLLPSVQSAREAARRASCINNLKQIGLALHNYHDAYGRFPPAAIGPHNVPRDRQFSWMVAILPYIERKDIYDALRLDLPWDHPHNMALLERIEFHPFLCPSEVNRTTAGGLPKTSYVAITGVVSAPGLRSKRGVIDFDRGLSMEEITDGASNLLVVGEVTDGGPWFAAGAATARPIDDWIAKDSWSQHPGVASFLFADGAVRSVSDHSNPDVLRGLAVAQSGLGVTREALDDPEWEKAPRAAPTIELQVEPAESPPADRPMVARKLSAPEAAPEAAPVPLPAPPRADRARLSLRIGLQRPADTMIRFHRDGGPEELVVGLQDQTAARILQWLTVAAAVLAAWAARHAPGPRKTMAVVAGLALPIGLAGLVPVAWAPLLDGLLLGTLAAGTLWLIPPLMVLLIGPSSAATTAAIVIALSAALAPGTTSAQQSRATPAARSAPATASRPELTLYVPYDPAEGKPLESTQVYLPHDEFLRLWKAAHPEQPEQAAPRVGAIVSHAEYVGRLHDDAGQFDGRLLIHQTADDWTPVVLPLGDVALEKIEIAGRPATLAAGPAGQPAIHLKGRGPHVVDLRFSVPVSRLGNTGRMTVPLRPVSSGRLLFQLPANDLEVQVTGCPGGWRRQRAVPGESEPATTSGGEFVNVPLGSGGDVTLRWQPRRAEVREESPMTVDQTLLVEVLDSGLHLHGRFHYRVRQGAIGRLQLRVPPGVVVRRVDGPELADWSIEAEPTADADAPDARRLVLTLKRELATDVEVAIDAFTTIDAAGDAEAAHARTPIVVAGIEPLGAARETGRVAIRHSGHFHVRVDGSEGLEQIDRTGLDLPPGLEDGPPLVAAYRYTARPWELQLAIERQRPQVDVVARSAVTVAVHQATLHSRLTTRVGGAPVPSFHVRLPAALRVAHVQVPPGADWFLQRDADSQRLTVALREPALGELELEVSGLLPRDAEQPEFPVPGAVVENARTQRGELAISLDDDLEAVLLDDGGARAVEPAALDGAARPPADRPVHYAFGYDAPPEGLRLRLASAPSRASSEATIVVSVREGAVAYLGKVDFDIRGAGRSEFQLAAPAWLGDDVELRGERIRQVRSHVDGPRRLWTVELQEPARGAYSVQWFQSLPLPGDGAVAAPVIRPLGVERSQIHVVLENLTADEMVASTVEGAAPVEASAIPGELDDSVRRRAVAAYRMTDNDAELAWQRRVRPQESGPAAAISLVDLHMAVHADGTYRARVAYSVRNSTLQFLELQLPPDSRIWSVHVADDPVRPATVHRGGRPVTLVPLQKTSAADFSSTAVLIYSGRLDGPLGRSARIRPPAPEILSLVPVSRTLWTLHLPSEYRLSLDARTSNMEQVVAAHLCEERRLSFLDELGSIVQVASKKTPSVARRKAQHNLREMGQALRTYAEPDYASPAAGTADVRRQARQIEAEIERLDSLETDVSRPDRDPSHYFAAVPSPDAPASAPDQPDGEVDHRDPDRPDATTEQPPSDADQPKAARDLLRKKAAEQLEQLQTMPDQAPEAGLPTPEATPSAEPAAPAEPPISVGTGPWLAETDLAATGTAYHFRKLHGDPRLVLRVRHQGFYRHWTAGIWAAFCLALAVAVIHTLRRPNAAVLADRAWPWLAALLGAVWLFLLPLGFLGLVLLTIAVCVLVTRSRAPAAAGASPPRTNS